MKKMNLIFLIVLSVVCTVTISAQADKVPTTGGGIIYENRNDILKAADCNASEDYIKKKVKAQLANYYTDYPFIAVDFTSFKGQNGYSDEDNPRKIIYPFKIEMLVYIKRKVIKEGKECTEYNIWKYDSVYEYATKPRKKCEFYLVPSSQTTRISHEVF